MKTNLILLALSALVAPVAAHTQVIEISDTGDARTYDQPTVFAGSSAEAIRPAVTKSKSNHPRALYADAARSHGLDQNLLEAVAWQESRGRMSAVSPKGALGVMQLMPTTAAELGVRADDLADNIRGGALYLRRQLDRFGGSVPLALAAYNAGPGAVLRYRGIPPYRETRDYVARIMQRWRPVVPVAKPVNSSVIEVLQP
ncbi:MAG: lytic transglycosylase domain-containing protein [Pseudomonadota bacterium]|nr:lytic transglycosylase domain-containing protein [Pseudomonadota bacterium]